MSYKKNKNKKNIFNQLKYIVGLVKVALYKVVSSLSRKEGRMRLPQTLAVMKFLRERNKIIRSNNKKIDEWIDNYINQCVVNGEQVNILTQWCLSKDLETRLVIQGGQFIPLKTELELIEKDLPKIIQIFINQGLRVNWWITFNGSFLERGRISDKVAKAYIDMIKKLVEANNILTENLILIDWEKEVLGKRPIANQEVLQRFFDLIPEEAFRIDFENLLIRVKRYPDFIGNEETLRKEIQFKIACEVEEGSFLMGDQSLFPKGRFILIPLEFPERYVFFSILAPDFKKRVVSILKPYPWRLDSDLIKYEI